MTVPPSGLPPLRPADLHAASDGPLALAAHGFRFFGIQHLSAPHGTVVRGQSCVTYYVPQALTQPWPVVMIHGGGGQALDFMGTADGRPGWLHAFLRRGHAVYLMDRPGHGRAPYHPDCLGPMTAPPPFEALGPLFARPEWQPERYPQARLHSQWPETEGSAGRDLTADPFLAQFMASGGPMMTDMAQAHLDAQRGGADLLDAIGPAILLTHSAGGPAGWMIADARPDMVKAIVAVEPQGPPFAERPGGTLDWGLTAAPLTFDPPAATPADIAREVRPAPSADLVDCLVQAAPARRLPNLSGFPIVVVTAEASWMAADNHGIVDFLAQAGAQVEHLRLADRGLHGNGHAMMLERNSASVAALLLDWLAGRGLARPA